MGRSPIWWDPRRMWVLPSSHHRQSYSFLLTLSPCSACLCVLIPSPVTRTHPHTTTDASPSIQCPLTKGAPSALHRTGLSTTMDPPRLRAMDLVTRTQTRGRQRAPSEGRATEDEDFRGRVFLATQAANGAPGDKIRCAFTHKGMDACQIAHVVPHSGDKHDRTHLWLRTFGIIPHDNAAADKADYTNTIPISRTLHTWLDKTIPRVIIMPTITDAIALCISAESRMLKEELFMQSQPSGRLWRMSADQLYHEWPRTTEVDGHKVPIFEYQIAFFATPQQIGDIAEGTIEYRQHNPQSGCIVAFASGTLPTPTTVGHKILAITPPFVFIMAVAGLRKIEKQHVKPLSAEIRQLQGLMDYWLRLASAENVSQWRSIPRPKILPPPPPPSAPSFPPPQQNRFYNRVHRTPPHSPSQLPTFSSDASTAATASVNSTCNEPLPKRRRTSGREPKV